jgi:hypothetical protein
LVAAVPRQVGPGELREAWVERLVSAAAGKPKTLCLPGAIRIARSDIIAGLDGMGAKFRPTIKDLKASNRYRQKQNPLHKFKKPADNPPAKKEGKK